MAQKQRSAIDRRTTRHEGYRFSQRARKRVSDSATGWTFWATFQLTTLFTTGDSLLHQSPTRAIQRAAAGRITDFSHLTTLSHSPHIGKADGSLQRAIGLRIDPVPGTVEGINSTTRVVFQSRRSAAFGTVLTCPETWACVGLSHNCPASGRVSERSKPSLNSDAGTIENWCRGRDSKEEPAE